ncbi:MULTISPECIES: HlyD family efflux transporter periplasmic adaptor subunit [unclassified Staphylococcus]|uniref:HlyD family secretion protein n=1 Tax=unclassified Staphylococcus TaxID=91994 RepID=UPI0021D38E13|nr:MULTISPECIES: HlyD family efflux transporter periplasmic adaptor subunit [unclassified Staphylococcus]UXR69853.1 HlyD family efflux transporter periplasmic adaptor subunit [Staphylococcus sp. IVB6246]UXR71892.1 HlyD family efflux transporter periplasmic adaptor subunit [Staphylococcus sp. IVB6240]UXR76588.1 HlyD family efflux transporter periplasmic adaptor subunit [Staphylococcus sp. IVB6233]UXR80716.1 HlyD family efflux transporter periplasmic adaptor subunit [Staphylococcus sp. IVB6218]
MKKLVMINIITIVLLVIIGIGGFYFYNQSTNYVKTENAQIDGEQIKIAAPASGQISELKVAEGDKLKEGDTFAKVQVKSETGDVQTMDIPMPVEGTVVKMSAQKGSMAQAGQPLAYAYNLDKRYVTANIDETEVKDVETGQVVDIAIDGQDSKVKGKVVHVGQATASSFSLMPSSNSDGNYTKVTQVIPVKIEFDSQPSNGVLPGMNAEVSIHKN